MIECDAFLYAICENPADDTVRLVYADWLQEHGDEARAGYIRRAVADVPHVCAGGRCGSLKGIPEFGVPLDWCDDWSLAIVRGFVASVSLPCAAFCAPGFATKLFASWPVTSVRLTDKASCHIDQFRAWHMDDPVARGACPEAHHVPEAIWRRLRNYERTTCAYCAGYEDEASGDVALSDACVLFGRAEAKLPTLVPPVA